MMGLFDKEEKKKDSLLFGLYNFMNEESDKDNDEIDDELNELQKEEIKKGNQDLWDFEEDDVDDDSYYSDDDE